MQLAYQLTSHVFYWLSPGGRAYRPDPDDPAPRGVWPHTAHVRSLVAVEGLSLTDERLQLDPKTAVLKDRSLTDPPLALLKNRSLTDLRLAVFKDLLSCCRNY